MFGQQQNTGFGGFGAQQPAQGGLFGQQPQQSGLYEAEMAYGKRSLTAPQHSARRCRRPPLGRRPRRLARPRSSSPRPLARRQVRARVRRVCQLTDRVVSAPGSFGGFGTQNRPAFGAAPQPSTGIFGAQTQNAPSTGFGAFGATANSERPRTNRIRPGLG